MANGDSKKKDDKASDSGTDQSPPPTILSWGIRGVSILVILGLIGYFIVCAVKPTAAPNVEIKSKAEKIEQRGGSYAVPVDVLNSGGVGLHLIQVTAELPAEPEAIEKTIIVPLLGAGEQVTVEFRFDQDPRGGGLTFAVDSYLVP